MQVRMADLPGIGKKISISTVEGNKVTIIIHHTGKRELYFFNDADEDEADYCVSLTADETRELGAQLLGATYQPVCIDQMKVFQKQLIMEWITLKAKSPIVNKPICDSRIRTLTGVSIVAIQRGEQMIVSPDPTEMLFVGDTVMAAGKTEQMAAFELLCSGEEK
ncbi:potassium transporter TrkA [Desulfuribacillus stibiiarsenatis]|uniref:Potassium transporter TrkA n=1 Tax=Desulfuribacillus stibiiarsenatis TaxID=1390249 RepID=A0A1E5L412_9FIRM|nr:cation:proton antiporter regulatory subunit [Desulfuribacillus stibiiarsenatis]OEH84888.1 potassium transporter TrkA [Desulfuribacillus stibiiarsenatis]